MAPSIRIKRSVLPLVRIGIRPAGWDRYTPWQPNTLCEYRIPVVSSWLSWKPYLPEDDLPPAESLSYALCENEANWAKGALTLCAEHAIMLGWLRASSTPLQERE